MRKFLVGLAVVALAVAVSVYATQTWRQDIKIVGDLTVTGTTTLATMTSSAFTLTDIDAGASGTAGSLDIFPATASRGKARFTATNNTGNTTTDITVAAQAGARTYTIPDAGASASFVMTALAQTIGGIKTFSSLANLDGGIAVDTSNFTVSGTTGAVATASTISAGSDISSTHTLGATTATDSGYIVGVPKMRLATLGTGTNGAAAGKTVKTDIDDDTPAGEWIDVDANTTSTNDTNYVRAGTNSNKVVWADGAGVGSGVSNTLGSGDADFSDDESIGLWVYSTVALDAGDLQLTINDATGNSTLNIPAVPANTWVWAEIDISAVANANKDVITKLDILQAVDKGAMTTYFDYMVKWDSTEEEALGASIQLGGVTAILSVATAAGSPNTLLGLTEYTDYFVNYQSGNDVLVWVTDQSNSSASALVVY